MGLIGIRIQALSVGAKVTNPFACRQDVGYETQFLYPPTADTRPM